MSPHFHFGLTRDGYDRCIDLLTAAGMTVTEERRDSFVWQPSKPPIRDIHGRLSSSKGTVRCTLRDCMGSSFCFTVTILDLNHLDILDNVERALAGVRAAE